MFGDKKSLGDFISDCRWNIMLLAKICNKKLKIEQSIKIHGLLALIMKRTSKWYPLFDTESTLFIHTTRTSMPPLSENVYVTANNTPSHWLVQIKSTPSRRRLTSHHAPHPPPSPTVQSCRRRRPPPPPPRPVASSATTILRLPRGLLPPPPPPPASSSPRARGASSGHSESTTRPLVASRPRPRAPRVPPQQVRIPLRLAMIPEIDRDRFVGLVIADWVVVVVVVVVCSFFRVPAGVGVLQGGGNPEVKFVCDRLVSWSVLIVITFFGCWWNVPGWFLQAMEGALCVIGEYSVCYCCKSCSSCTRAVRLVNWGLQGLLQMGIRGVTVSDVRGFGAQGGSTERHEGIHAGSAHGFIIAYFF